MPQYANNFKKSIVHPVYKGKGKDSKDPASYRPIAILPAVSKILERVVAWQLTDHLEDNSLLPREQHGFRKGRSTITALQSAFYEWTSSKIRPTVLSFDYTAAFDTLDPSVLDKRLRDIGATDTTCDWFKSYMLGGQQAVKWRSALSEGSILGPILFILVTAQIASALGRPSWLYADDSTTSRQSIPALESAARDLVKTSSELGLVLNPSKTQVLHLGQNKSAVEIGGIQVEPSATMTLLGLTFDRHLSTAPYLASLVTSLSQRLGMVRRLRASLPPNALKMVAVP